MARSDRLPHDRNLFGGEFTPFRDMWNAVAADAGITTKRMRTMAADEAAEEARLTGFLDEQIASSLRDAGMLATEPTDRAQLAELDSMRKRYAALATHHDPAVRTAALTKLATISADPVLTDIEAARETQRQEQRALRLERRNEYKSELSSSAESLRNAETEFNTFTEMLNEAGASSSVVQARFRDLVGLSGADVRGERGAMTLKLGPLGSVNLGGEDDKVFSYDEMLAASSGWYRGQRSALEQRLNALAQAATNDGFALDTRTGSVELEDLNELYAENRSKPSRAATVANPPPPEPTTEEQAKEAASAAVDAIYGGSQGVVEAVPPLKWLRDRLSYGLSSVHDAAGKLRELDQGARTSSPAPAPEAPFERDGTLNGVYIPRRLRHLFQRRQRRPTND